MHTMNSMDVNNAMDDRKKRRRLIAGVLFTVYFAVLFYFLFFSEKMGRTYSERAYHYNLVPLKEIMRFIRYRKVLGTLCSGFKPCGKYHCIHAIWNFFANLL